jgi:DNA-binding NarL/FixJ family response regulator
MLAKVRATLKVLIVDDHPVVISGCELLFSTDRSIRLISARDEKSGYRSYLDERPDVAILDINLPDLSGFELLRRIRKEDAEAKIIIFSMNDDPAFVLRAVELGARGYISKSDNPELLLAAVKAVAGGETFVTPRLAHAVTFSATSIRAHPASQLSARELEILRLLSQGKKLMEVADAMQVSYKTIANSTSLMKQKLGARSHSDLIRLAVEIGL